MRRVIRFEVCKDCPFLKDWGMYSCPVIGGKHVRGCSRWIPDINSKPNDCPYPKGIIICGCGGCPYREREYCTKIRKRSLVPIKGCKGFHEDCPLEVIK
jgi:hypothetical protein